MSIKYKDAMMETAVTWSEESSCKKRKVGCVISINNNIASIGFNGTIKGTSNCCEITRAPTSIEDMKDQVLEVCGVCKGNGRHKIQHKENVEIRKCSKCNAYGRLINTMVTSDYTLHAEANAVKNAHELGIPIKDAVVYVTLAPCKQCAKLLASHQIKALYYKESYKSGGVEYLNAVGITVEQLND